MIDNIAIDFQSSENFASIKDIRKKCNPIVNLLKFIFNKKILNEIVVLSYNKVCRNFVLSFFLCEKALGSILPLMN